MITRQKPVLSIEKLIRLRSFITRNPDLFKGCRAVLYGVRGFFPVMGTSGKNDIGIYDDAMFLVTSGGCTGWNANTDPSKHAKGIAMLKAGVWWYEKGKHGYATGKPYNALRQSDKVTVLRDGQGERSGNFFINIHKGGRFTTGSLGCQTIPDEQWDDFISAVYRAMDDYGQKKIPYILVEEVAAQA